MNFTKSLSDGSGMTALAWSIVESTAGTIVDVSLGILRVVVKAKERVI